MVITVVVIDMQNAYFEDPALGRRRDELVEACNALMDAARSRGAKVLLVKTEHERDKSTWSLNMLEDNQGFIFSGSEQADFIPGLATAGLPQLVKTRDSAFLGTDLLWRLRNWDSDTIVLAGVSSHNCVAQTGADAFGHNVRVVYAEEATGSEDREAEKALLSILTREYRQEMLRLPQIEALLDGH
jgi:nicotinamidase-related amidase